MKKVRVGDIKPEDVIERNFQAPDLSQLRQDLENKTVLITGAGGSIGSELSRQIMQLNVKKLILAEHSEINLYNIIEELSLEDNGVEIVHALMNICNKGGLEKIFSEHKPDYVYHAAAYKHVHLVEANPLAGILNNIVSTYNLLQISEEYKVEKFVLISTDKAVRPTNVMGATKRICELLTNEFARRSGLTFTAVRFGNVVGSSGSLLPKLKKQIAEGKPLTITDLRMTRFFMLIPEAVSLVLKASEVARPSDIILLNMGKSIKIIDIAYRLLRLSGREPEDYPVDVIGARPGEKLYEELFISKGVSFQEDEQYIKLPDGDQGIKYVEYQGTAFTSIESIVTRMVELAKANNRDAIDFLWTVIDKNNSVDSDEELLTTGQQAA